MSQLGGGLGGRLGGFVIAPAVAVALMALAGCLDGAGTASEPGDGIILTVVPASAPVGAEPMRSPEDRYPRGSQVVLFRPAGGDKTVLSDGFFAAGGPELSPDAASVAFAGRRAADSSWSVYEVNLPAGEPRRVFEYDFDCVEPAYLAGSRLVVACATNGAAAGRGREWALYTVGLDGSGLERITYGPTSARAPAALLDGRIVFSSPRAWNGEGAAGLFAVNPDGTLLAPFTDDHGGRLSFTRPRATTDNKLAVIGTGAPADLGAYFIDTGNPFVAAARLLVPDPQGPDPPGPDAGARRISSVEAISADEVLIVSHVVDASGKSVRTRVQRSGVGEWREVSVVGLEPAVVVEAIAVRSRKVPRGRPRNVSGSVDAPGFLLGYDAARGDGQVGAKPGGSVPATLQIATRSGWFGQTEIAGDGSFFVQVPANEALRLRTLAADGTASRESGWLWVRPGEVLACFGCHESRSAAPINRALAAILSTARKLQPPASDSDAGGRQ